MGVEELPGRSRISVRVALALSAAGLLGLGALAGCGGDDSDAGSPPPGPLEGPEAPQGDIVPTSATLRSSDGFTTLATTQVTTRGGPDTLVFGQVALTEPGQRPRLRLVVDGEVQGDATVNVVKEGGDESAVLSCACSFEVGEHDVELEGTASQGVMRIGARSLAVFPAVDFSEQQGDVLSGSVLQTDPASVTPEGTTLASLRPREGGEGPLLILAGARVPRAAASDPVNTRLEVMAGDELAQELTGAVAPATTLIAFYDSDGVEVGEEVEVRAFTTAGRADVAVTLLATCSCEIGR